MTTTEEERWYAEVYNAHERAESAAIEAMRRVLADQSSITLACLADPTSRWQRSSLSPWIVELADEVLTERLDARTEER